MIAIVMSLMLSVAQSQEPMTAEKFYGAPKAPQKEQAFTTEERQQALEALRTIAKTFEEKQTSPFPAPPQKSMADVADKALDISTKYIGQAAAIIEKAAPRVWAVMVRQQYAKAFGQLITPLMIMLLMPIIATIIRRFWKLQDMHFSEGRFFQITITLVIPTIVAGICAISFAVALSNSIMYLVNPEYYAIKDLVQILLHPSSF